ncbi:carboxysome shell protein, partial [Pseudomonadota bacterium]
MWVGRKNRTARPKPSQPMRVRTAADVVGRQRNGRPVARTSAQGGAHPFSRDADNTRLYEYESRSKQAFDKIETVLREIAQHQHSVDFVSQAQQIAQKGLGFSIPQSMLDNSWVDA